MTQSSSKSTSPHIMIQDLCFQYDGYQEGQKASFTLSIDHLMIHRGEVTAILGKSGCGKTTLLSLLGLLRAPQSQSGSILYHINSLKCTASQLWSDAQALDAFRAHKLGFALQRGELLPFLTNVENVALAGGHRQENSVDHLKMNQDHLHKFCFASQDLEIPEKLPSQVSQGQYLRVGAARALVHQPPILLADEPTGALDPSSKEAVMDLLCTHAQKNQASVVLVTHDLALAHQRADHLILLSNGEIQARFHKKTHWRPTPHTSVYT